MNGEITQTMEREMPTPQQFDDVDFRGLAHRVIKSVGGSEQRAADFIGISIETLQEWLATSANRAMF